MSLTTWDKTKTIPFIDTSATATPEYKRIGKSTIFNLALNAQTETFDFIEDEIPSDMIKNYKPELPMELYTAEGDDAFDALFTMFYSLPVGTLAIKKVLLVFPKAGTVASTFLAWQVEATVIFTNFDTVAKKLSFNLNFSGDITRGTVAIAVGVPTFTADA